MLSALTKLTALELSSCKFTALAPGLAHLPHLLDLNLSGSTLGGGGSGADATPPAELSLLSCLTALTALRLASCDFSSVPERLTAGCPSSLQLLDLSRNPLGKEEGGVASLSRLADLPHLAALDVRRCCLNRIPDLLGGVGDVGWAGVWGGVVSGGSGWLAGWLAD